MAYDYAIITKYNVAGYTAEILPSTQAIVSISPNPTNYFNVGAILEGEYDGTRFHTRGIFLNGNKSILPDNERVIVNDSRWDATGNNPEKTMLIGIGDPIQLGDGYVALMIQPDAAFGVMYRTGQYAPNVFIENDGLPYAFYRLKNNFVSNYSNVVINKMNYGKPVSVFQANKYVYGNVYAIARDDYNSSTRPPTLKYALLTKINPPQGYDFNWLSNTNILNPGGTNYPQYQYAIPLESLSGPVPLGFVLPAQTPPPNTNTEVLPVPMPKPKPSGTSDTTTSTSPKSITTTVSKKRMVGFANE